MFTTFKTPNLVREISRKTGLIVSSNFFLEMENEANDLSVSFYLANADDKEIVVVRFKARSNGKSILFLAAWAITVETASSSWFGQETKIVITDDQEENHPVIANMVAKILKNK